MSIKKIMAPAMAGWDTNKQAASPFSPTCLCPILRCVLGIAQN
ncbi:hypothetical protein [Glaciecola sp. 1036]